MEPKHQRLREEVVLIARRLSTSGLVTGTSGNVSARTPNGDFLITPSGIDYQDLEPGDVTLVALDGRVSEGSLAPSTETPMHAGLYRSRPWVGGIVHTHARFSTTLACLGWPIPPVHYMLTALSEDGRVPVAPYATYGTEDLARHASEALGERHKACLLQNHGTLVVGQIPGEAYALTETLEEVAQIYFRTKLAGEPVLLTPEQVKEASDKMSSYARPEASSRRGR